VYTHRHTHADPNLLGSDIFNAAHHSKALVEVDQRQIERGLATIVHHGRGVDRADPF
jgi:hypothetical protein